MERAGTRHCVTEPRTTMDVVNDHLELRRSGRTADDLERNYADDVIVLSHLGQFRGLDSMRIVARLLDEQLVGARFDYEMVLADEDFAFVRWSAEAQDFHISDGVDSFCVRDGRIVAQTIYYSLSTNTPRAGERHEQ